VEKQAADYSADLRQIALDYYSRRISFLTFRLRMTALIGTGLTRAWLSGREAVGKRGELTFSDRAVIQREVTREVRFLDGFTRAIESLIREGKDVDKISRRIDLWGDAFVRVQGLSTVYNGESQLFRWTLHPAEHCQDCTRLSGMIKTAKEWIRMGYYPKSWSLACRQGCKCSLDPVGQTQAQGQEQIDEI
jgi:hypothetical protein